MVALLYVPSLSSFKGGVLVGSKEPKVVGLDIGTSYPIDLANRCSAHVGIDGRVDIYPLFTPSILEEGDFIYLLGSGSSAYWFSSNDILWPTFDLNFRILGRILSEDMDRDPKTNIIWKGSNNQVKDLPRTLIPRRLLDSNLYVLGARKLLMQIEWQALGIDGEYRVCLDPR